MNDERLKMVFGFCVVGILTVLASVCLKYHYDQADDIVGALIFVSGAFTQWAFGKGESKP